MNKKRRAVVIGFQYYAKFVADLMNEHSERWEMRAFKERRWETLRALLALRKADALICFGGPAPDAALIEAARKYGVHVIVVWAGSDVIGAQANPQDLQLVREEGFHHISDGAWLVDELEVLGLHAEYEPLTAVRPGAPVKPLPNEFRVLTYLPEPRRDFYGASLVYEIARRIPDVQFTVVGAGGRSPVAPSNVVFLGYVDYMQQLIDDSTVLLRLPRHDGKSMLVLEALARARHVIWNYEFPHVDTARNLDAALEHLRRLRRLHESGELTLNDAGREFVLRTFGRKETAARLEARLERVVRRQPIRKLPIRKRVAISGLRIFCADIAGYARRIAPEWELRLLRTNSRLEILTAVIALAGCDVWYSIGNPVSDRWLTLASRLLRKPRVVHWVGSDILALARDASLRSQLSSRTILHLAEATWTVAELERHGLMPRLAPLPPRHHHGESLPLPQQFTVLLYVPRTRSEFYGKSAFERLMDRLKGRRIRYIIVGGGTLNVPDGVDATDLGWRNDLRDAYRDSTVLVRFTPHDGLSLMVLEALSYGRHVIWTQPFPFVKQVHAYGGIEQTILDLLAAHERGELAPQTDASDHVRNQYSPEMCVRTLAKSWSDAAQSVHPNQQLAVELR